MIVAQPSVNTSFPKSAVPARLDLLQSASGLLLGLFMWGHMFFVSSILISERAMWTVTKMFEGYFVFGRSYYWMVSAIVACVIALFVGHAFLAMRKFPINYRQWRNTARLVRSLLRGAGVRRGEVEVVVVDNHSPWHRLASRLRRRAGVSLRRWSASSRSCCG